MITLQPLKEFKLPVVADCICPSVLQDKTRDEIETLRIWEGNKQRRLCDLFKITVTQPEIPTIAIDGDMGNVRQIGKAMAGGEIVVNGNAGMHLGEEMKAGKITIHGSAGSWAGSMMEGGIIDIHGDAGDYLGAPPRGSTQGMRGGTIVVHGNACSEAGAHMKRGSIRILGNVGQFAGFRMQDGTIYIQGRCEARVGACMVGGRLVAIGPIEEVLPTFTVDSVRPKVKVSDDESVQGPFYVLLGDLAEGGNGKLYVSKDRNPQLSLYDRFI